MSQSCPIARHRMPQKQTHQIAITALRSLAPLSGGLGPGRCGRAPSLTIAGVEQAGPEKSLPKGLGEDYGQLRRGEIDGYLGNPGLLRPNCRRRPCDPSTKPPV